MIVPVDFQLSTVSTFSPAVMVTPRFEKPASASEIQ